MAISARAGRKAATIVDRHSREIVKTSNTPHVVDKLAMQGDTPLMGSRRGSSRR
jgi:hypothetical protein